MPQPAPPVRSSAAPETFWTKVDGHRIFALRRRRECSASSEHPPLILVHGLGVSGKYMIPTAAALAARYDVYVPDLPGFGKSSKPRSTLDVREHANVLAAWMSAIGCERAVLIGNSFAGRPLTLRGPPCESKRAAF
ncbi:MAG: alpha/beta fold hydrolase [Chloroflexi bacterium]|nr:alpha/beta fold hydrolase [Chloroflexota bacterium]